MKAMHSFTASADTQRTMPERRGARLDRIEIAIHTLRSELHRLERLGLDAATRRCRQQLRYWEFLQAVFSLEPDSGVGRNVA